MDNENRCPECGYINKVVHDICPSCGFNLREYQIEQKKKEEQLEKEKEEKLRLEETENQYLNAINLFNDKKYQEALKIFTSLNEYKDSKEYINRCYEEIYNDIVLDFNNTPLLKAVYSLNDLSKEEGEDNFSLIKRLYDTINLKAISEIKNRFIKLGSYKDSQFYIDSCVKAKKLYDEYVLELSYQEAKENIEKKNYEAAIDNLKNLNDYKDSTKLLADAKENIKINEIIKRGNQRKEYKKQSFLSVLHLIILIVPIILSIIFGNILFNNRAPIFLDSDYDLWLTLWIVFLVISILSLLVFGIMQIKTWGTKNVPIKVASVILLTLSVASSVAVFPYVNKLSVIKNYIAEPHVDITVSSITHSKSGSKYNTTITFTLKNKNNYEISELEGDISFYNQNKQVGDCTLTLEPNFNTDETVSITKTFTQTKTDLYETSELNLGIRYEVYYVTYHKSLTNKELYYSVSIYNPNLMVKYSGKEL